MCKECGNGEVEDTDHFVMIFIWQKKGVGKTDD